MIWDIADTTCYIGSTTETLASRMAKHRSKYKAWLIGKSNNVSVYTLFNESGVENCNIYLLVNYPCSNIEELNAREGFHQRNNECVNKYMAARSFKEYYRDNRDKILERVAQHREEHLGATAE